MKYIWYILKTKLFYFSLAVYSLLCIAVILCFQLMGEKIIKAAETFDKFTASMVAYDPFCEQSDSFANFGDTVIISATNEEGEGLNLQALQFLDECQYTDKSVVNSQTVCVGEYTVLKNREIAIPQSVASRYGLSPGSKLYVDGQECVIKYLFEDVYQITSADFSIKRTVAFLGVDTVAESKMIGYCNFDPSEKMHQQIKSISSVRDGLKAETIVLLAGEAIVCLLIAFVWQIFRRKGEIASLRKSKYSGERNVMFEAALVELAYTLPVAAIVIAACILSATNHLITLVGVLTIPAAFLVNMLIVTIGIRR